MRLSDAMIFILSIFLMERTLQCRTFDYDLICYNIYDIHLIILIQYWIQYGNIKSERYIKCTPAYMQMIQICFIKAESIQMTDSWRTFFCYQAMFTRLFLVCIWLWHNTWYWIIWIIIKTIFMTTVKTI